MNAYQMTADVARIVQEASESIGQARERVDLLARSGDATLEQRLKAIFELNKAAIQWIQKLGPVLAEMRRRHSFLGWRTCLRSLNVVPESATVAIALSRFDIDWNSAESITRALRAAHYPEYETVSNQVRMWLALKNPSS